MDRRSGASPHPAAARAHPRAAAASGIAKRRLARPAAAASAAADSESEMQGRHRVVTKLEPQSHIYLPESYHSESIFFLSESIKPNVTVCRDGLLRRGRDSPTDRVSAAAARPGPDVAINSSRVNEKTDD